MSTQTPQTPTVKAISAQMRSEIEAMPEWLRRPIGKASELSQVQKIIKQRQIHTICEEGRCPNRGECYAQKTATFLLMGPTCTRACAFCQVDKGHSPMPLDPEEPQKVAEAVQLLGLRYAVLTSVARDDLPDGGAGWFARTIAQIRLLNPDTEVEVALSTGEFIDNPCGVVQRIDQVLPVVDTLYADYSTLSPYG